MTRYSAPPTVERVGVAAYTIPIDQPAVRRHLGLGLDDPGPVTAYAGGATGIGWTYTGLAAAQVVIGKLAEVLQGRDATTPASSWAAMQHAFRNLGRPGLVAEAISAVDIALWDLHARLLDVPLTVAIGAVHEGIPDYGSGGFTSYADHQLAE